MVCAQAAELNEEIATLQKACRKMSQTSFQEWRLKMVGKTTKSLKVSAGGPGDPEPGPRRPSISESEDLWSQHELTGGGRTLPTISFERHSMLPSRFHAILIALDLSSNSGRWASNAK